MPVPFHLAALGGEIEVPTLNGYASLKVPAGTESGTVFRLRGKGVTSLQGYGAGDQHVRVVVDTPDKLSSRQRDLLRQFGETLDEGNHPRVRQVRRLADEFYRHKQEMGK